MRADPWLEPDDEILVTRGRTPEGDQRLRIELPATNAAAREAINVILGYVDGGRIAPHGLVQLEIALAEVFNNIVEHAYEDSGRGDIDVTVDVREPGLHFTIIDTGVAMPANRLPGGTTADPGLAPHEQPEGGYGLYLVRQLARKLRYTRDGDTNCLTFRIRLDDA